MGIMFRYIARKFWPAFFFGLAVFAVLVFLGDFFDRVNVIVKSQAGIAVVLKYFAHSIPFWMLNVVPVAALLACLFTISGMMANGEWVAAVSSGYRPSQLYRPIVFCSALVCLANFAVSEAAGAYLHSTADTIFERDIRGKTNWSNNVRSDIVVQAGSNQFLSAKTLNIREGTMERVLLDIHKEGKVVSQVDASSAVWNPSFRRWVFYDGTLRDFSGPPPGMETPFISYKSALDVKPANLIIDKVWPEDLNIREILTRISLLEAAGLPSYRDETYMHAKLAAPFAHLLICLIGITFAVKVRRTNRMLNFAVALVLAFLFWWALSMGQAAGEGGMVPPWAAGWLPLGVFGGAALLGLRSASR